MLTILPVKFEIMKQMAEIMVSTPIGHIVNTLVMVALYLSKVIKAIAMLGCLSCSPLVTERSHA